MHRICEHPVLLQRTRETARTGAAGHSTLDGRQGTRETVTSGLKPPSSQEGVGSNPTPGTALSWAYMSGSDPGGTRPPSACHIRVTAL